MAAPAPAPPPPRATSSTLYHPEHGGHVEYVVDTLREKFGKQGIDVLIASFRARDVDQSNSLDSTELQALCDLHHLGLADKDVKAVFRAIDGDANAAWTLLATPPGRLRARAPVAGHALYDEAKPRSRSAPAAASARRGFGARRRRRGSCSVRARGAAVAPSEAELPCSVLYPT